MKPTTFVGISVGTYKYQQNKYQQNHLGYYIVLTDSQIKKIKPPLLEQKAADKYSDGQGLQLHVFANGGKYWRMAYRFAGKQKTLSIGIYPIVSLAEARTIREDAKRKLRLGIDPMEAKKETQTNAEEALSFKAIATQWLEDRKDLIEPSSHARNVRHFVNDVFPMIGSMRIDSIKAPNVLAMARKIEERGAAEMARRALRLTSAVMRYAKTIGHIEFDPTTGLSEALKPRKVQHMARISETELPKLLQDIDSYSGEILTCIALKLITLTFVRTIELRHMEWTEIDYEKSEWRIPAEKMKMSKIHIVPLSKQSLALLSELEKHTGQRKYVFHSGRSNKPMSEVTILAALWRMGYKGRMTGHGFRGLASTILHERNYNHAAIELQLAHSDRDQVSAAYNYADHLPFAESRSEPLP
ncbi:MAG: tyrosine-type recombinase/integrase [Aquirhabdus sp.]